MNKIYVKENLRKIKNAEDVNFIISTKHDKLMFITAGLTNGKEVQLTTAQKSLEFSEKPMHELAEVMGLLYMEDFIPVCEGFGCLNRKNVESFSGKPDANPKFVDIIVKFKNGQVVNLYAVKEKNIKKELAKLQEALSETENDWTNYQEGSFLGL